MHYMIVFRSYTTVYRLRDETCDECYGWRAQDCYYPSWTHSNSALAQCTPLQMLDIFILCALVELSVSPTNRSPVATPIASSPPHRTRHAHHHAIIISWHVVCIYHYILNLQLLCIIEGNAEYFGNLKRDETGSRTWCGRKLMRLATLCTNRQRCCLPFTWQLG